jgi:hypothetical protein
LAIPLALPLAAALAEDSKAPSTTAAAIASMAARTSAIAIGYTFCNATLLISIPLHRIFPHYTVSFLRRCLRDLALTDVWIFVSKTSSAIRACGLASMDAATPGSPGAVYALFTTFAFRG